MKRNYEEELKEMIIKQDKLLAEINMLKKRIDEMQAYLSKMGGSGNE